MDKIAGYEVVLLATLPEFRSVYEPPKERMFEYEKSDEEWLKYFGYGHMAPTTEPLFLIGSFTKELYTHPNNYERLKGALKSVPNLQRVPERMGVSLW
jgi:hypothetical protein